MHELAIARSADYQEARERFLDDVGDWARDVVTRLSGQPANNSHDQGTVTTAWAPYIQARSDPRPLEFMTARRDAIRDRFVQAGKWHHGYWRRQEAHHGTEHFELFLGSLLDLLPQDEETRDQLLDAAEHIGNWVEGIPAWFDWEGGLFRSMWLGTEVVEQKPSAQLNVPDHMRCVNICLIAHRTSGDPRYLHLAREHALRWADAIVEDAPLPVGLDGPNAVRDLSNEGSQLYRQFAGQAPESRHDVDRTENFLASGTIHAFMRLWEVTGDATFRQAAERLLDVLATQLRDPDAGSAADAIRFYRRATGDRRYDSLALAAVDPLDPRAVTRLGFEQPPHRKKRPEGIGKRSDMPAWFENGRPRKHNPILFAFAAEITEDRELAARSVDLGRAYLQVARDVYPDGEMHGCSARTVSAIARGHGRENGAGVVTAVLGPLTAHFG